MIRVEREDIESQGREGNWSEFEYVRFHIREIDAWGVARYNPILRRQGHDVRAYVAAYLSKILEGFDKREAKAYLDSRKAVIVPTGWEKKDLPPDTGVQLG